MASIEGIPVVKEPYLHIQSLENESEDYLKKIKDRDSRYFDPEVLWKVETRINQYLKTQQKLFQRRVERGLVHEGVGDILSVVVKEAAKVAPDRAEEVLESYSNLSSDTYPKSLAHFYQGLELLKEASLEGGKEVLPVVKIRELLDRALAELEKGRVLLLLIGGLPGTGKTTIANKLSETLSWVVISSREVRKDVNQQARKETTPFRYFETGQYATGVTDSTYLEMARRAKELLEYGETVVATGSFNKEAKRATLREVANSCGVDLIEICLDTPVVIARFRSQRTRGGGDSEVSERLLESFDRWPEALRVDTTELISHSLNKIKQKVAHSGLDRSRATVLAGV